MTRYEFPSMVAKDPTLDVTVRDGVGQVYALLDTTFATPLTAYDKYGALKPQIGCTHEGQTEEFYVDDHPVVWWYSGGFAFLISSYTGMLTATRAAQDSSAASANAASASKAAAELAASLATAPADAQVAYVLGQPLSAARQQLETILAAVGVSGTTADTYEAYKAIMFSDGSVKAVPSATPFPPAPTGLLAVAGPTAVTLKWNKVNAASRYVVYRNGSFLTSTTNFSYRDSTGQTGATYTYTVASFNSYGMRSQALSSVTAFLDPALNTPSQLHITTWPAVMPTTGKAIIRVNAWDLDGQTVSPFLTCSTGSLQATFDPSVWIYTL
jgi:hypothetical protein